jgi:hypothetical protein
VLLRIGAALAAIGVLFSSAESQTVTLDEGAYRISVNGKEIGTETFSIRQNGNGESGVIIAVGRATSDAEHGLVQVSSELQVVGKAQRPAAYEVRIQGNGNERITGRVVGNRFSAQITSPAGESMREYLAGDGAVILDEGVAHHYFFLARRVANGTSHIPVIIPRQNKQVTAEVSADGNKLTVKIAGMPDRIVQMDEKGHVVRVEIPATGFVAQRVEPSR